MVIKITTLLTTNLYTCHNHSVPLCASIQLYHSIGSLSISYLHTRQTVITSTVFHFQFLHRNLFCANGSEPTENHTVGIFIGSREF